MPGQAGHDELKRGARSLYLDFVPEAEAVGDVVHARARRLVAPGGALVAGAVDHHVVELNAVRTGAVGAVFSAFSKRSRRTALLGK